MTMKRLPAPITGYHRSGGLCLRPGLSCARRTKLSLHLQHQRSGVDR